MSTNVNTFEEMDLCSMSNGRQHMYYSQSHDVLGRQMATKAEQKIARVLQDKARLQLVVIC